MIQHSTINGVGLGLRFQHIDQILAERPPIPWFEALTDNYLKQGSVQHEYLMEVAEHYPLVLHGVGMSLGSAEALNIEYLTKVKVLAQQINAQWVSDHLCWTGAQGLITHDLLPLPYNQETLKYVINRIKQIQDILEQTLVIENVSSYLQYKSSDISEWDFIAAVVKESKCKVLLDINNIYVNSYNHEFDPLKYLNAVPIDSVQQMHLAGFEDKGTHLLDTHGQAIYPPVWELYAKALQRFGAVPTLIEWDNNLPSLERLMQECDTAQQVFNCVFS